MLVSHHFFFEILNKEDVMKYLLQVVEGLAPCLAAILNVDVDLEFFFCVM